MRCGTAGTAPLQSDTLLMLRVGGPVTLRLGVVCIEYDPSTGVATFDGGGKRLALQKKGMLSVRLLADTMSCEFFLQEEISASYSQKMAGETLEIGGPDDMKVEATIYRMKSIWE